jgi:hypothetical protein
MNHIERRTCQSCKRTKPAPAFAQHGPICRVCVALPTTRIGAARKTSERELRAVYARLHIKARVNARMGR